MPLSKNLLVLFCFIVLSYQSWAQCNALRPQKDISFNTDQACAPVRVSRFKITYYFDVPQPRANISILYTWNDPANTTTLITQANGLVDSLGGMAFKANATFTYTSNRGQCSIRPTVTILINGVACPTSAQPQTAYFWSTDDQANGRVSMTPQNWDVCFDNAIVNARFRDNSEFNCNIRVEPDNPNRRERHVQFVYGTNHNAGSTIRNLSLNDAGVKPLTNGTGALATPQTRGLVTPVTAGYFGPINAIPFPADAPTSQSFVMNAPADVANAIGNRFEVTMYNWNVCNPWNGDNTNPNYEDAIVTRGYIRIVAPPAPAFATRDGNGVTKNSFCIGENIFLANLTPNLNSFNYTWQFYNDAAGTQLIGTSTQRNPTFAYTSGGIKLIRLRATNPTTQTPCEEEITAQVIITPALAAKIGITDLSNNPIGTDFCQEPAAPLTSFDVRFTDLSTGTITANTGWRWEFFDENNVRILEAPTGGGYASAKLGPFDRVFTNKGIYRVHLSVRDNVTLCESSDEVTVRVFEKPVPVFTFNRACVGNAISFVEASTLNPLAGEQIVLREWDMDYDGTFVKDASLDNKTTFDYTFSTAASHRVALRVTTNTGSCSNITEHTVLVDPQPVATFTTDQVAGCSVLTINFTNTSIGQPGTIDRYIWEIDAGAGFVVDSVQRPSDPGFGALYVKKFVNSTTANVTYAMRLRVISDQNCEALSAVTTITVFPGPRAGYAALNYTPFNDNCSPVGVNFSVDGQTRALNPSEYIWTITDAAGPVDQISTGTTPTFTYSFVNTTASRKDYSINLRAVLSSGCYGDSTKTIRVNPRPSSEFTIDTVLYDCEKVVLNLNAKVKGLLEYAWSVSINGTLIYTTTTEGDNFDYEVLRSVATDQTVDITLVTTNLANCQSDPTTHRVVIFKTNAMTASFTVTPPVQTLPASTVTIQNTTPVGPWQYEWDFGDNTKSVDPNVTSHTYTTYGTYPITLTVWDNDCKSKKVIPVKINPIPPILDFDYFPPSGCAPLTVSFVNKSQYADPSTYQWKFGNGQGESRAVDPTYTYFDPGVYSVTLSATNVLGEVVSITKTQIIEVYKSPVAQFAVYPKILNIPGDILYTNNKSIGATSYLWDFGDGNTSIEIEPQHKYKEQGSYDISLIAYNDTGCSDTVKIESAVQTNRSGQLKIPNAFTPNRASSGSTNVSGNEIFLPLMRGVTKFSMMVFTRWGEKLFESTDPEVGWDGYYKGVLCQQDVYIYKIVVEYEDGKQFTRTGDVNLIR